ncbi:Retrovirus-related Pol polyprotein from transposon TNT 1-94 [Anthophora retusa]
MDNVMMATGKIEQLTNKNYHVWALKVGAALRSRKLFKEVIEKDEPPVTNDVRSQEGKDRLLWETKNDEAFGIIILTLSDEHAGLFLGETSAKKVWNELKNMYMGQAEDQIIDIGLELRNIRMGNHEAVIDYINRARNIASRSAALGRVIATREIVYHVVRGVHAKFERTSAVLRAQRDITLEDVQRILCEEEGRLKPNNSHYHPEENVTNERAYRASYDKPKRSSGCYICGRQNHLAKDCFHRNNRRENKGTRGRPNTGNRRGFGFGNRREQTNLATENHEEYAFRVSTQATRYEEDDDSSLCNKQTWIVDSGTSSHMSPDATCMTNIEPYSTKVNLAENGKYLVSKSRGDVHGSTTIGNSQKNIRITNVLHIPNLRTSLLSVSQLVNNGNKVVFSGGSVTIIGPKKEILGIGKEQNGIYTLETCIKNRNKSYLASQESTNENEGTSGSLDTRNIGGTKVNVMLWHRRLGHICEEYLTKMRRKEMVRGLDYPVQSLGTCEVCIMGKGSQLPHQRLNAKLTKGPLDLIHIDLCGPMPIRSLSGSRYMFVLIDDYSRYICVYFLRTKDETFNRFKEFMNRYENKFDRRILAVRSDNGREFVNSDFQTLFREKGIRHERTVPYNPESNGIAERANRTLLDKARTMLIDSSLPGSFWAEAVATAAYLRNRCPVKGATVTPIEMWEGKKPTVSHVKVFGCTAYYYIPKNYRSKFEPISTKGIFIGYSNDSRAYRIYNTKTGKIHAARSVKFNENVMGSSLVKTDVEQEDLNNIIYTGKRNKTIEEDYTVIDNEDQEEEQINRNNQEEQVSDRIEDEEIEPEIQEIEEDRESRKCGRKLGRSNQDVREEHRKQLIERERRLREEGVKRSRRLQEKEEQTNFINIQDIELPNNHTEAIKSKDSENWEKAMAKEITTMNQLGVWKLVQRQEGIKTIKSRWVYSKKQTPGGDIKYKARLVAVGCNQKLGINYEESFAPVIRLETARIMLSLAAIYKMKIKQFDVKSAYLYGDLKEKVYMEQPPGFARENNKVCELRKSIYGLPQSGYYWNEKLHNTLVSLGLIRIEGEPCAYISESGQPQLMIGIYVDDFLIIGSDDIIIEKTVSKVRQYFELTEIKDKNFLNIKIIENEDGIQLSQAAYIEKILKKYNLEGYNPVKTPMCPTQDLDVYEDSPKVDKTKYQELLGSLMYVAIGTRPDISYAISRLSQYNQEPRVMHLTAVKRVYRYLKGTRDYKLQYDRQESQLTMSTDASWSVTKDAKSYGAYVTKIGNNLITWKCQKQQLVALSTCEAELLAICEGVREIKWIKTILEGIGMGHLCKNPIEVKTDSKAAMEWINKDKVTNRTKHINRKYYFVKDEVKEKRVKLKHTKSEENEADLLTKGLTEEKVIKGVKMLQVAP